MKCVVKWFLWILFVAACIAGIGMATVEYAKYTTIKEIKRNFTFDELILELRFADIGVSFDHGITFNFMVYAKNLCIIGKPNKPFNDGLISHQPWYMFR